MKTKRKYFYLDDFEHRLLVGCLMTARNEYLHEGKPIEDVDNLILKIIDAPSKKMRVIRTQEVHRSTQIWNTDLILTKSKSVFLGGPHSSLLIPFDQKSYQ